MAIYLSPKTAYKFRWSLKIKRKNMPPQQPQQPTPGYQPQAVPPQPVQPMAATPVAYPQQPVAPAQMPAYQQPMPQAQPMQLAPAKNGNKEIIFGILLIVGGIGASLISYMAVRETGGTYYIFWYAPLAGIALIVRGFMQKRKS